MPTANLIEDLRLLSPPSYAWLLWLALAAPDVAWRARQRPARQGWNVDSRGCNPRCARPIGGTTLEGSNRQPAWVAAYGPFRAVARSAPATVGCRPRLFTLKPSGFRQGLPSASSVEVFSAAEVGTLPVVA